MPVVMHKELNAFLQRTGGRDLPPVVLIHGEEVLCRAAFDALVDTLLPEAERSFNFDVLEGDDPALAEALARINTYGLLPGTKVVAVRDARVFYAREDRGKLVARIRRHYAADELAKAARVFVDLLALLNLAFEDVGPAARAQALKLDPDETADAEWPDAVIGYCRDQGLSVPAAGNAAADLEAAVEKGFPRGHHLLLTTDLVDKRRRLYKALESHGLIVDCAVPKGSRQGDEAAREAVLQSTLAAILETSGKQIDREAFQALCGLTGFDLPTFTQNVEKLVAYSGDRRRITLSDVENILERTRKDPLYAFTNAVGDRNAVHALFFMQSLLADDFHPLQILAAVVNLVRRLLVCKGFTESPAGGAWHPGMAYGPFQQRVLSAVLASDQELQALLADWDAQLAGVSDVAEGGAPRPGKKRSKAPASDLVLAKTKQSAYPVFQNLLKADKFTGGELTAALEALERADRRLKSTGQDPKLVLEEVVLKICTQGGGRG